MEQDIVYGINRGIGRPIEFRGVKAQYIGHLAGSVLGALMVFIVLHVLGVSGYVAIAFTLGLGGFLVARVYGMSRKYGAHGWMKRSARKAVPQAFRARSRLVFTGLMVDYVGDVR